jgi:ATP-dependent Clp protease ATP-binding subunit ClpC
MPGKAKLLLESAASYATNGFVTETSVQTAVEKSYGVKVKVTENKEEREKLLNLEELIHERMVDQKEAVSAISNALRRAGAGVKNKNRPIGTFLFLGPTGVGKTELAKTLSEVYFNGEEHVVRLDMNEFVSSSDVSRLIKDGASDALSLTAQIMKQPFSVVLLDEIEKAHPSVLTTLLQVLDEGILRDEKNREVSFRDSIIIATSNAGANEIREKITAGEKIEDFKEEFLEKLISSNEFKPEFLNRFDEICLFKPLSKEDLTQILDLIIASTNRTLEPQKIAVNVSPEAKQILLEKGYDPKMGARPMRRIVQKTVENIVAAAILSGAATPGSTLTISPSEIEIN